MKDETQFAVFLIPGSRAAMLLESEITRVIKDHPILICSEVDLSGFHSRIRLCPPKNQSPTESRSRAIVAWIATGDIAAAIQFDKEHAVPGFVDVDTKG